MERWLYLNKKMIKRICLVMVAVLVIIYVVCVVRFNLSEECRRAVYEYYEAGDVFEYKGTRIKFLPCEIYYADEFEKVYNPTEYGWTCDEEIYIIVKYEIEKLTEEGTGPDWTENHLCTFYTSNQFPLELSECVSGDITPVRAMEVGDKQLVKVGFVFHKVRLNTQTWENAKEEDFYVEMPDYEGAEYRHRIYVNR